jgi:RNA polymerase-binding transcription factor DksA
MPAPPATPRPDETGPDPALPGVTARLREERAALSARIARLREDMGVIFESSRDSNADDEHDPEGQTIAFERSQLAAVTEHALAQLAEVDAALQRADDGTYGVCEVCGQPIAPARLDARPTARTCVPHAPARGR